MTRSGTGMREVADGVILLARAHTNCYLVETDAGPVLVDAGLPRTWPLLRDALGRLGHHPRHISGVYLTHGHFDHVGMADRLSREHAVPIHVHPGDRQLARHPYSYAHESPRVRYPFRYPRGIPILARMTAAGALAVHGVRAGGDVRPSHADASGLIPLPTPGHTAGHCAFLLPDRGVLFAGDALVTLDPYTGATGPRVVAGAATADRRAAREALGVLADVDASILLPGHGEPWTGSPAAAVDRALAAPVA